MREVFLNALLVLLLAVLGCGGDEGEEEGGGKDKGRVVVSVAGGALVEGGIPSVQFADGWSVTFHRFVVLLHDPMVTCGEAALPLPSGCGAFDLTAEGGVELAVVEEVEPGACTSSEYGVAPAEEKCAGLAGNADPDLVETMIEEEYSVFAEGIATKGGMSIEFSFGFSPVTRYSECPLNVVVEAETDTQVVLTLRGERIFLDDLENPDAVLRFQAFMAADLDADGFTTGKELKLLSGPAFHALENYGVGSTGVDSLYEYMSFLSGRVGFGDGDSPCVLQ